MLDFFKQAANLTPLECEIMETRISGMTRTQQSFYFNISVSALEKIIARLKKKYDAVQKEFPDRLKPRRASAAETYMDEH